MIDRILGKLSFLWPISALNINLVIVVSTRFLHKIKPFLTRTIHSFILYNTLLFGIGKGG